MALQVLLICQAACSVLLLSIFKETYRGLSGRSKPATILMKDGNTVPITPLASYRHPSTRRLQLSGVASCSASRSVLCLYEWHVVPGKLPVLVLRVSTGDGPWWWEWH